MSQPNPNPGICCDCGGSLGEKPHWIQMRCGPCRKEWKSFCHQKYLAGRRSVGWELTFQQWLGLWVDSGNASLRGSGRGKYCMARNGDAGPYRIGNVSIQLCTQNSFDGAKLTRAGRIRNGNPPKGWVYVKAYPAKPYQVAVAKHYIGNFASQAEAEAAYAAEIARRGYIQSTAALCAKRPIPQSAVARAAPAGQQAIQRGIGDMNPRGSGRHGQNFCPAEPLNATQLICEP